MARRKDDLAPQFYHRATARNLWSTRDIPRVFFAAVSATTGCGNRLGEITLMRGRVGVHQGAAKKGGWQTMPFEQCIEQVVYTAKVQRKTFLSDGAYPIVSQEDAFINGYWDNEADLFKIATPIVVFGDHTKVLKYVDFDFVLGADGVKILQPRDFLLPVLLLPATNSDLDSLGYARHYKLLKELKLAYHRSRTAAVVILDEAFEGIATAKANAGKNLKTPAPSLIPKSVFTQRRGVGGERS